MTLSIADKQSKLASKRLVSSGWSRRHIFPEKNLVIFDEEDQRDYTDDWVNHSAKLTNRKKMLRSMQLKSDRIGNKKIDVTTDTEMI